MPQLPITLYDDAVLRQTAQPIAEITARHAELARDMAETMYGSRGIGLAANQVGVLERIIVVDTEWPCDDDETPRYNPIAMLNPEVLEESTEDEAGEEGCLSLPEIRADVYRPLWIRYRYQDLKGRWQERRAEDLQARCILHELDHLNGVLFIDRVAEPERRKLAGKLRRIRDRAAAR